VESMAILEESALILEESALILEESFFMAVESFAASLEPALLQAAKAPIANTIKNFFISDCFLR
jgi:hypothetical protein